MTNHRDSSSQYDTPWHLRKESRETWDYIVSDKLIYFLNSGPIAFDSLMGIPKSYIEGDVWVEVHLISHAQGETHYTVIAECDRTSWDRCRKHEINDSTVNRNSSVLINIAEFVEPPEHVFLNVYAVPSVMRLKRVDNGNCSCGHAVGVLIESSGSVVVPAIENRELSPLRVTSRSMSGQCPHQLVERGSEAVENISGDERQMLGRVNKTDFDLIQSSINIDFFLERAWLRLSENRPLLLQSVKMFLRPRCLQIGISETHVSV